MLTQMTDADWEIVVEAFRAARSRRGDKGRDDRKFSQALHYFTVHNLTWRALPAEFGHWNSVWKRFWRLSQRSVFEAMLAMLAGMSGTFAGAPRPGLLPPRKQKVQINPGLSSQLDEKRGVTSRGICPPSRTARMPRPNRRSLPKSSTKERARAEQGVGKIKRFKRIALRCEKTAQNFAALISIACTFILVKSVHTT